MHKVSILNQESILVGSNLTLQICRELLELNKSAYVIVTDENVSALHLAQLKNALHKEIAEKNMGNIKLLDYVIPPGEVHKTRKTKAEIEDFMLSQACTRDTCLIALGGGVIGDMVGYVAATFMRGIPIIQIPTTLLAMVDSSIGGKTAIDTPNGKNLIGAFHQPLRIFIDINYLKTLPKREFVNGLSEVIKTAAIWDQKDFELLENYPEKVLSLVGGSSDTESEELLVKLILGSVKVKAHVVTIDERETGLRGLLNFGHSIGHAIEQLVYPDLLHGECVAIGMILESQLSRHLGYLSNISVGRLQKCLMSYGLPVSLEDPIFTSRTSKLCGVEEMMTIMKVDKKNKGSQKRIVLLKSIGSTVEPMASFVDDDSIRFILCPSVRVKAPLKGEYNISVPGSKSISNRALLMAALGTGTCKIYGLLYSDDVKVMLNALENITSSKFLWESKEVLLVIGGGGKLKAPKEEIFLGNAGTASRFLTSVCTLIKNGATTLTGNHRMKERPIGPLLDALRENGALITCSEKEGYFPLQITSSETGLAGGKIQLSASISSQYVSSILLAAPLCSKPVELELVGGKVISQLYIDMTVQMMAEFNIKVERIGSNLYRIPNTGYMNPAEYHIEADASSATYPLAYAAITGSTVTVDNIGSKSLQGDAAFAVKVLEPMGCIVVQTETSTTVTGPKSLKPIGEIDMESMTDAFMTAAVLAAVANKDGECITKINGIANQRVKECNRIEAMITEFKKLGIEASELTDGLQIHGIAKEDLKYPAHGIYSYDDHRIAMSFSVLSCAYQGEGPIITQKVCVEKTWPGWWDQLKHNLGCTFTGIDLHPEILPFNDVRSRDPNASIVLIGMRGAGKSHMGKAAAKILNRKFIDLDDYFEQVVGINIPAFVKTSGWELFREKETELLKKALEENSTNFVISCGGGVVEAEVNRNILKSWIGIVIHIQRDLNAIAEYLEIDTTRPSYAIPLSDTWIKRKPWYQECSSLEYFVLSPSDQEMGIHYRKMEQEFGNFLKFALSSTKFEYPAADSTSFFVCLTCPNVNEVTANLDSITTGVDAVELRVDLLKSFEPGFIAEQIALIRHFSLGKPIVYTVRTKAQGGNFPDNNPEEMIDLLKFGIKCGCEYIDIEFTEPYSRFDEVLKSIGNSRVIGSYHDVAGNQTWTENGTMVNIYKELHKRSDIVKLIGRAHELSDNFTLHQFVNTHVKALQLEPKPIIALLMGASGQLSRHLNNFLTPVTHPLLTTAAAPGQVSVSEIHQTRHNIGLLPAKSFCLFGSPISQSMSPTIHNTGYEILGLPFNYSLEETSSVNDVEAIMRRMNGASVTIPLKVDVLKSRICSEIDPEARKIGAINTLTKTENGIRGSNTDWIGIKACIEKHIQHDIPTIGVVIGAGGTSRAAVFALQRLMGIVEVRIWNRTVKNAEAIAQEFNIKVVHDLKSILATDLKCNMVVVGTIPASAQQDLDFSMFSVPSQYVNGVMIEMAYRPRKTPLITAAEKSGKPWALVEGIQVLLEQGYEQFRIWTGKLPPRQEIKKAVLQNYN